MLDCARLRQFVLRVRRRARVWRQRWRRANGKRPRVLKTKRALSSQTKGIIHVQHFVLGRTCAVRIKRTNGSANVVRRADRSRRVDHHAVFKKRFFQILLFVIENQRPYDRVPSHSIHSRFNCFHVTLDPITRLNLPVCRC